MVLTVFLTLLSTWYLTSILKLPLFLGLCLGFLVGGIEQHQRGADSQFSVRWALSFLLACALLGLSLQRNIYPGNLAVLVAAAWALALIYCGSASIAARYVWTRLKVAHQQDPWATRGFVGAWAVLVVIGSFMSVKMGMSWDASLQQETFETVLNTMSLGLQGNPDYALINDWYGRYYGVGFHFLAYQWHMPLAGYLAQVNDIPLQPAIWLSRQWAVFVLFAASSGMVAWLVYHATRHLRLAMLSALAYLLYPYLLGHGMFNMKDTPFAVAWLLGVVVAVKAHHRFVQTGRIPHGWLLALMMVSAGLITVRVAGVLFAVPCLLLLLGLFWQRGGWRDTWQQLWPTLITGGALAVFLVLCFYPVAWQNPVELLKAITEMSSYPWEGCTLTHGQCMDAHLLPLSYIPHWLLVKLPLFVGLGLLALPWVIRQLYRSKANNDLKVVLFLWLQVLLVVLALMLKGVALYDEIRQILFIVPVLFVAAVITLYHLHRGLSLVLLALSALLFAVDNVKLYPFQLAWFNESARLGTINGQYETEYWGTGLRHMAKEVQRRSNSWPVFHCVYSQPYEVFRPFMNTTRYPCQGDLTHIQPETPRPFLYVKPARNLLVLPTGCRPLHHQTAHLWFAREPIRVAEVGICE